MLAGGNLPRSGLLEQVVSPDSLHSPVNSALTHKRIELMKVFISWSGEKSRKVATFLSDWISCVLQATEPWISDKDIDRGALWFSEINNQLGDTKIGIICLTEENKEKPWILFEAGALAKGLPSSRVCTFLIDLQSIESSNPLTHFNYTLPDKNGLYKLVKTLNNALGEKKIGEKKLDITFNKFWPEFEKNFSKIIEEHNFNRNKTLKPYIKKGIDNYPKKDEHSIRKEWKETLRETSTTSIFIIRGKRLFDPVDGPFYLPRINTKTSLRVLLLDLPGISDEEYKYLSKNYSLDWENRKFDETIYQQAINNIKNIQKKYKNGSVEIRKYSFANIPNKKTILFENNVFYANYQVNLGLHQFGEYYYANSNDNIYLKLQENFENVWNESKNVL